MAESTVHPVAKICAAYFSNPELIYRRNTMSKLMSAIKVGPYEISHRVVLAPLTRIAAENGNGYLGAPGLFDDSQIAGWKHVTDAVHAKGGKIFLQLYHAGRQSNVDVQPEGSIPVGPSEVLHGGVAYTTEGWVPNTPNRALTIEEIAELVESFRTAAERGVKAGFDGVELHGANGYLVDQFLQDNSNKRTDAYGGSFDNRARLLMEATRAVISVWGSDKVAVRLGPSGSWGDMSDSDPVGLFSYVAAE